MIHVYSIVIIQAYPLVMIHVYSIKP